MTSENVIGIVKYVPLMDGWLQMVLAITIKSNILLKQYRLLTPYGHFPQNLPKQYSKHVRNKYAHIPLYCSKGPFRLPIFVILQQQFCMPIIIRQIQTKKKTTSTTKWSGDKKICTCHRHNLQMQITSWREQTKTKSSANKVENFHKMHREKTQ